jgi:peptidoglycan DL-endopeptidase CwlO
VPKPSTPAPERRPITLDQLPAECRAVLASGAPAAAPPADKAAAPEPAPADKATAPAPATPPAAKPDNPAARKASLGE